MAERVAILVTGSRDWRDWRAIEDRLKLYPRGQGTVLIHGDCGRAEESEDVENTAPVLIGADWIAARIGRRYRFEVWGLPYFTDLDLPGKPRIGGPRRNEAMFNVLLALRDAGFRCFVEGFPLGKSFGTRGMLRIVQHHNDRCERDGRHSERVAVCVTEGKADG